MVRNGKRRGTKPGIAKQLFVGRTINTVPCPTRRVLHLDEVGVVYEDDESAQS